MSLFLSSLELKPMYRVCLDSNILGIVFINLIEGTVEKRFYLSTSCTVKDLLISAAFQAHSMIKPVVTSIQNRENNVSEEQFNSFGVLCIFLHPFVSLMLLAF